MAGYARRPVLWLIRGYQYVMAGRPSPCRFDPTCSSYALESIGTLEHQYDVSEDRAVLAPGFRVLDERERTILHLRFFEGLTQSQIAQQVGISQMHVSRLIRRSLEKIREEIAAEESSEPKVARG